jgi:hypothetical protein
LIIVFLAFAASGCAIGVKHSYTDVATHVELGAKGGNLAVAVHDQRGYVVSGAKAENFVGLQRGGFGNPFDVMTESGAPLAQDLQAAIVRSLRGNDITIVEVRATPAQPTATVKNALLRTGAPKSLLVTLAAWNTDTYLNTALVYDVNLVVFDATGKTLASRDYAGRDDLGGSAINPPSHARTAVPMAVRRKIKEMFDDPEIIKALR